MSVKIRVRRGLDADRLTMTPDAGEFIFTTDEKQVWIGDGTTVGGIPVATGAGPTSGDVVGPASATDNALVRWDGTTGKLIQDSSVLVTDAGWVAIGDFVAPPTPLYVFGEARALTFRVQQIGQSSVYYADTRSPGTSNYGGLVVRRDGAETGSLAPIESNAPIMRLVSQGYDGTSFMDVAHIETAAEEDFTGSNHGTRIVF